jgi:micrococcal nuclease
MDLRFNIRSVDRVTDGDTVHVTVDLGFKVHTTQIIRLAKINCPELETVEGNQAHTFTWTWLTEHEGQLILDCHGQDKYAGRWIGTITNKKGESLNQALIDAGHAKKIK